MKRLIASLILFAPGAFAQERTQIAHFESGRFEKAISSFSDTNSADSLAFMARTLLAKGMCGTEQPSTDLLNEAESYARKAIAIDSQHVEGQMQLAISLSLKARPLSTRAAMRTGYGDEAKALAEAVLEIDPNNTYAHGFMMVWNIEVVRRGGALGSRIMGASVKKARKHYDQAIASSPDDASIHWQYARALAALNVKKYRGDIDSALEQALSATPDDYVERVMISRALELNKLLDVLQTKQIEEWAENML